MASKSYNTWKGNIPSEEGFHGFQAEDKEAAEVRNGELQQAVIQELGVKGHFSGFQEVVQMDIETSEVPLKRQNLSPQERRKGRLWLEEGRNVYYNPVKPR